MNSVLAVKLQARNE